MIKKSSPSPTKDRAEKNGAALPDAPTSSFITDRVHILDPDLCREFIRQRQRCGIDGRDEVWEGVYVVPPLANNPHQGLVTSLSAIFHDVIVLSGLGQVFAGANVSDRREGWEKNFRVPDLVVVLRGSRAVDCTTHWCGGPDFLIEIASAADDADEKIPFYGRIGVRELLVIGRDSRELRLYHLDAGELSLAGESTRTRKDWLESSVIPFAFRWQAVRGVPRTELKRRDRRAKGWSV